MGESRTVEKLRKDVTELANECGALKAALRAKEDEVTRLRLGVESRENASIKLNQLERIILEEYNKIDSLPPGGLDIATALRMVFHRYSKLKAIINAVFDVLKRSSLG